MCYILLAISQSKKYPFILAANRDEFYQRASSQLAFWQDKPHVAGGRDLEQSGTWMAVTKSGRFAAITNFREAATSKQPLRSRGLLINDFLDTDIQIEQFSATLVNSQDSYSGYNLIYGNLPGDLFYYSNRRDQSPVPLPDGMYALSNHLLDTPWPKVVLGKQAFESIVGNHTGMIEPALLQLLGDQTTASSDDLPKTGIDSKFEKLLSSIYIESENYGTRCSSVITVNQLGQLSFTELTHDKNTEITVNPVILSFGL